MTIDEMQKGYKNEVDYQKHMLRNLEYWVQLFLTISAVGLVLIYYYHQSNIWLFVIGIILMVIGIVGMLTFGYASWRGHKNVALIIKDYENKLAQIKKIDQNPVGTEKIKYQSK